MLLLPQSFSAVFIKVQLIVSWQSENWKLPACFKCARSTLTDRICLPSSRRDFRYWGRFPFMMDAGCSLVTICNCELLKKIFFPPWSCRGTTVLLLLPPFESVAPFMSLNFSSEGKFLRYKILQNLSDPPSNGTRVCIFIIGSPSSKFIDYKPLLTTVNTSPTSLNEAN